MRILLIGASGQVGTEVQRHADVHGVHITVPPRADFDLLKPSTLRVQVASGGYDGVINAAAYNAVDNAETEPEVARIINAESPEQIALGCADAGIPLVHYSTDYVFNGETRSPYKFDDPTDPLSVYGATKRDGESLVADSGAIAAIIRLSWVFSVHGDNFVKTMLRLAETKDTLTIVADQHGKPTPASAAADAGLVALKGLIADPKKAGIYQFCGAEEIHWADFARVIFDAAGLEVDISNISTSEYPTLAKRPNYSVMCTDRITAEFGITVPDWRSHLVEVIARLQSRDKVD